MFFLASKKVGPNGRVIGIDMTEEILEKAKQNARKVNCKNVVICINIYLQHAERIKNEKIFGKNTGF